MVEEHLKQLITQHFDPKKADLIFTEEGSVCLLLLYVFPVCMCSLKNTCWILMLQKCSYSQGPILA